MAKLMPVGKYKGLNVWEVPVTYLATCIENQYINDQELIQEIKQDIVDRLNLQDIVKVDYTPMEQDTITDGEFTMENAKKIYKKLSTQFHPDKEGGSDEGQKALNLFMQLLIPKPKK